MQVVRQLNRRTLPADRGGLLVIAQRLHHHKHFLVRDEASSMADFVLVDGVGQVASFRREVIMTIGELTTLATR